MYENQGMPVSILRIKGRFQNYSSICTYAPTEDKSERKKDHFYKMFKRTYMKCPFYYYR
jgi:hypothetical protein